MSVWTDPIVIPPLQIIIFILGFLINKIIDKKAGRHLTDLERLNYVSDGLVNTGVMHGKKIKGAVKTIMADDHKTNSETIPGIHDHPEEDATVGLVLSEMQLDIDEMKDKMSKAGIDMTNGDEVKTESNVV